MLNKYDYRDAYLCDGAANLSGLAHSLANMCAKIREDARERGVSISTEEINRHPIVMLYARAIYNLSGARNYEALGLAYEECKEKGECYPFVMQE